MKCINCSAELTNEKFCPYCGTKVVNMNVKEEKKQGIPVVVFEDDGEYSIYYPDVIDTDSYEDLEECKDEARTLLDENFGDYTPLTEEELLNDRYTKKLIKKGLNASIDFLDVDIDKLKLEYEDSLETSDMYTESEDNASKYFENASFHSKRENNNSRFNDRDFGNETNGVYAYIEKDGIFFEGDIPGLDFCKEHMCNSYEECLRKLRKNYEERRSRAFFEYPNQNLNKIKREHPKANIVKID